MTRTILHSRLSLFAACAAVTLGLTSIGVGAPAARAAGSQTATVDFASTTGPVTGVGSGFLYGRLELHRRLDDDDHVHRHGTRSPRRERRGPGVHDRRRGRWDTHHDR